ncbi:hypothetical protein RJ55_04375 [Drechmeria coniospora]|nr:hypothetical protein RJ55_04375 [Drechmeria coniospora]
MSTASANSKANSEIWDYVNPGGAVILSPPKEITNKDEVAKINAATLIKLKEEGKEDQFVPIEYLSSRDLERYQLERFEYDRSITPKVINNTMRLGVLEWYQQWEAADIDAVAFDMPDIQGTFGITQFLDTAETFSAEWSRMQQARSTQGIVSLECLCRQLNNGSEIYTAFTGNIKKEWVERCKKAMNQSRWKQTIEAIKASE